MFNQRNYHFYNLRLYRKQPSEKTPTAHQLEALEKLDDWFKEQHSTKSGGILVLPTGSGKTFTTVHFLCTSPLSKGYKILWLAHAHHLLDQAFDTFKSEVKHISPPKTRLDVRVVSGTQGHCRIDQIELRDDVVIATLQTITRAYKRKQPQLEAFFKSATDKIFVVFDEAHHSPSPTYRKLITAMQERFPKMYLLGLTATPSYTNKYKYGWLEKLFPQRIIYQVTAQLLMADGILSKPEIEQHKTNFEVSNFEEEEYNKWIKSYQDIPENIISELAENRDRNAFIAETYANDKERYGKTIMFADRWFQCEQLREFLENRGVRAGVVYSGSKSSEGGKIRNKDENAHVLDAFRKNDLDVLINIKMLTEGTDVPDVQTVFLTRETTSNILLTQMVGRALRGLRMGGTEKAYIVAFIDIWKYEINWAGYDQLTKGFSDEDESGEASGGRSHPILVDLVRRLAQQMDRNINTLTGAFLTLLPLGWYQVEFETVIEGSEDDKTMTELVMVFEGEKEAYECFMENIIQTHKQEFNEVEIHFDQKYELIRELCIQAFYEQDMTAQVVGEWLNENLLKNLFHIARHVAQNEGYKPPFFLFEERKNHDLDAVAQKFINDDLGPRALEEALQLEFNREDRYWKTIYYSYELFKQHYNSCVDRALAKDHQSVTSIEGYLSSENLKLLPPFQFVDIESKVETPNELEIVHQSPKYQSFSDLPTPKQICSLAEWKDFICDNINLFYGCEAVQSFKIMVSSGSGKNDYWVISLDTGIDCNLIKPLLKTLMQKIQTVLEPVGYIPPEMLCVNHVSVNRKNNYVRKLEGIRPKRLRASQTEWILKPVKTNQSNQTDRFERQIVLVAGERILVISGPFKDFEGDIIEVYLERQKLKALLSIFERDTPVELDFNQVQITFQKSVKDENTKPVPSANPDITKVISLDMNITTSDLNETVFEISIENPNTEPSTIVNPATEEKALIAPNISLLLAEINELKQEENQLRLKIIQAEKACDLNKAAQLKYGRLEAVQRERETKEAMLLKIRLENITE